MVITLHRAELVLLFLNEKWNLERKSLFGFLLLIYLCYLENSALLANTSARSQGEGFCSGILNTSDRGVLVVTVKANRVNGEVFAVG